MTLPKSLKSITAENGFLLCVLALVVFCFPFLALVIALCSVGTIYRFAAHLWRTSRSAKGDTASTSSLDDDWADIAQQVERGSDR